VRRLFLLLFLGLIVVVGLAVVGPSLPEGNPLRDVGESLNGMFTGLGRGFGGGYQPISPSG
jgi:hypothetical protein